jgi:integrase
MSDILLDLPSHLRDRLVSALESGLLGPSPTLASLGSVLGNREDAEDLAASLVELGRLGISGPAVAARGLLRILWDFAMWRGDVPTQRNPVGLVSIKDATRRMSKPRSLTVEEFQRFIVHLREPFRTMALLCVCFGLRISECFALRWSDLDWLNGKLTVERGIVRQHVDDVKTTESRKQMSVDSSLLEVLKRWKQTTQFFAQEDWMFASPVQLGRLPWSYPLVLRVFGKAASDARIAHVSTHAMRHSYRAWLDAVGTSVAVQQKLMRHADIRTTMNTHGDVVTDEMSRAASKVAGLALNGKWLK